MLRFAIAAALLAAIPCLAAPNLLTNPRFEFHAFENHRLGSAVSFTSHNVAYWNTDAWGDITVTREAHVDPKIRPAFSTGNLVSIAPGKKLWQFVTLPEIGLAHGDHVALSAGGYQPAAGALMARLKLMKLDSEDGTWKPSDFGMGDSREFPKHSRGELVVAKAYEAKSDQVGAVALTVPDAEIVGRFHQDGQSHSDDVNTIGVQIEFENVGKEAVWVWGPSVVASPPGPLSLRERGSTAGAGPLGPLPLSPLPEGEGPGVRPTYRHIPRTMQKLWKGEPLHIILMGSSIDRGSANPPMYLFDENPASPTFKKPLAQGNFDGKLVGRPDLDGYIGWWQHYFDYAGRLRLELMRKFNLPVNKLCLNIMACDGSCVGEAHSGLKDYCSLSLPPEENTNGHKRGKTWQELYPELFSRPEGPRPDLVIFGSGANEKTDSPDEVAVFEGAIRWIQSHYPQTEFLFCMFQNYGGYTPNAGDMQALALRYGIPVLDYGRVSDDVTRWCSRAALVPADGHPQAAAHYLWYKELEKAFECWDPIVAGQPQTQLPERLHANTYGWEGEMVTFHEGDAQLKTGGKFVLEDTAFNCWGAAEGENAIPYVDGRKYDTGPNFPNRDIRNSLFRNGQGRLGDRHILELAGKNAKLTAVDAKICPNRRVIGVDNPLWRLNGATVLPFASEWGAPYGAKQVILKPGATIELDCVATDLSVAYVDTPGGGKLWAFVDDHEALGQPTNVPFIDLEKKQRYMENRRGILGLGYGLHTLRIRAVNAPVAVLGVFAYDSRPNRQFERHLAGQAAPGEWLAFSPPFRARPVVICSGGLEAKAAEITPNRVEFGGTGTGWYQVTGE